MCKKCQDHLLHFTVTSKSFLGSCYVFFVFFLRFFFLSCDLHTTKNIVTHVYSVHFSLLFAHSLWVTHCNGVIRIKTNHAWCYVKLQYHLGYAHKRPNLSKQKQSVTAAPLCCPAGSTCLVPRMAAAHSEYDCISFFLLLFNRRIICSLFLTCVLFFFLIGTSVTKSY